MLEYLNFDIRRKVPLVRQAEGSECSLACIAMVARFHGLDTDLVTLRRRFQTSLKGSTLSQILKIAEELGFSGRPLRGEISALQHLTLPAILHWNLNHFVVLTRVSSYLNGRRYEILDPAVGPLTLSESELGRQFTGVMLELVKSEQFEPRRDRIKLKLSQLWSRLDGFWPAFVQVLTLSAALQLLALAAPFYLQISIDTVLPSGDADLLVMLALGFAGVALISTITSWLRAIVLVRLGTSLSYQVTVNLFRQLLRLPLPWFEKRHVGDVVSRFGSTKPISDILSQGLISTFVDGVMAIVTLTVMFVYSPTVSLIACASVALTTALRFGFFSSLRIANVSLLSANARESSAFIETIRGIATIKSFGEEANRQRLWQQKKADAANAEIKTGRLNAAFSAGQDLVTGIERVLFVYIAIRYAIQGMLSLGMIFALQAYRQQFLTSSLNVIQQAVSFRLLDMHLGRIADIALSPAEPVSQPFALEGDVAGVAPAAIELRNVRFRYAMNEPEIIKGVRLSVSPGEMVALVGPSGGGKTTLMKIMMGLLEPWHGDVLVADHPLASYGILRWRREIGSVAQDDTLFAGSLADNICMFDSEPDSSRIETAARAAQIHDDIERMPMRYHTPVGDMGSVLSGGQKQRVVLARAFYRNPTILFLDEATAHLDPKIEFQVGEAVRALGCTKIVIAHRPQTIARADRLFHVENGQIIQVAKDTIAQLR